MPATSSPPASRQTRAKKRIKYAEEEESGTEDLVDSDCSDEFTPRPEDLLEVDWDNSEEEESEKEESEEDDFEEELEANIGAPKKKRTWDDRAAVPLPSDDEEEDSEVFREARLNSKMLLREEMQDKIAIEFDVSAIPDKFVPDREDEEMIAEFMVKPLLEQSSKWRRFRRKAQDWIKAMVMRGEMPTGKTVKAWADVAHTPAMYVSGLKALLGKYQEELRDTMPHVLVEGRLHIWAMFKFKTATSTPFPTIISHLLDKIELPSKQKFALAGFAQLVDSCYTFLSTPRGKAQFFTKTPRELINFPTAEFDLDFAEHVTDQVDKERNRLKLLKETIKTGKPYGKFQADIRFFQEEKKKFMEMYEGATAPIADQAIPKYMEAQVTRDLYKRLEKLASEKALVSSREMVNLGKELFKR